MTSDSSDRTAMQAELIRSIDGATAAHRRLLDAVTLLAELGELDLRRPSLLPDWSVGHVLAHLARNADSHVRLLDAGARGEQADQYEGGMEGRAAEIERDAVLDLVTLVADLGRSAADLEHRWATMPADAWQGEGRSVAGAVALSDLPFRRWRETDVHHVDLGLGYTPDDWPAAYVRLELVRMEMLWAARRPMGLTAMPAAALAAPPAHRLAWLLGRGHLDGLAPAGIF
jgi:maleylpyruvate isomerase